MALHSVVSLIWASLASLIISLVFVSLLSTLYSAFFPLFSSLCSLQWEIDDGNFFGWVGEWVGGAFNLTPWRTMPSLEQSAETNWKNLPFSPSLCSWLCLWRNHRNPFPRYWATNLIHQLTLREEGGGKFHSLCKWGRPRAITRPQLINQISICLLVCLFQSNGSPPKDLNIIVCFYFFYAVW